MFSNSNTKIRILAGALLIGALLFFYAHKKSVDVSSSGEQAEKPIQNFLMKPEEALEAAKNVKMEIPIVSPQGLSEADSKKWDVFTQILNSRNDNDPRLDTDLKTLSPELHKAMMKEYQALPMEKRNERGLVAYLIARDLQSADDMQFLKSIYDEAPCLSLENCASRSEVDPHHSGDEQVSQNYPQMAALFQMEKQIQNGNKLFDDPKMKESLQDFLRSASQFSVPMVSKKAESIMGRLLL